MDYGIVRPEFLKFFFQQKMYVVDNLLKIQFRFR